MNPMCDVPNCTRAGKREDLGCLCPKHSEACEKARDGDSWTQAFIDAGPEADADDVVDEWYSRWLVGEA